MRVGFTGTQQGMTEAQKRTVQNLLVDWRATELHHGDCIGADAQAHAIAKSLKLRVVLHPPTYMSKRAFCVADEERQPLPYLDRNGEIVLETERLIAAPKEYEEQLRSGTWATVRRARKQRRHHAIVLPNGNVKEESY